MYMNLLILSSKKSSIEKLAFCEVELCFFINHFHIKIHGVAVVTLMQLNPATSITREKPFSTA